MYIYIYIYIYVYIYIYIYIYANLPVNAIVRPGAEMGSSSERR